MPGRVLVVGAGPFGLSVAALARDVGLETVVVGRPMGFWIEHMPEGMFLRSGVDWHLDAAEVHTLEAYSAERALSPAEVSPIPVQVFRDYGEWFRRSKRIDVRREFVTDLIREGEGGVFEATLAGGERVRADAVVAAPGIASFTRLPACAGLVPPAFAAHSCDLVRFDGLSGRRVLIVGGRQSAYEWAALISEHDAARVDVVHRHPIPRFAPVSWAFFDDYVEATLRIPAWWRRLAGAERQTIVTRCWQAGRGTLEPWLPARLDPAIVRVWPDAEVVAARRGPADGPLRITLSNAQSLHVDQVLFATGYAPDLARVGYLRGLLDHLETRDGFPVLDEALQSTVAGLYLTGFVATRDFGPFFGFVKAAPASARLIVRDLQARWGLGPASGVR